MEAGGHVHFAAGFDRGPWVSGLMMRTLTIDLGGEGEAVEISLTIKGCSCRAEDFHMALIGFANQWKREADARTARAVKAPCGCKDAQ